MAQVGELQRQGQLEDNYTTKRSETHNSKESIILPVPPGGWKEVTLKVQQDFKRNEQRMNPKNDKNLRSSSRFREKVQ